MDISIYFSRKEKSIVARGILAFGSILLIGQFIIGLVYMTNHWNDKIDYPWYVSCPLCLWLLEVACLSGLIVIGIYIIAIIFLYKIIEWAWTHK